MEDTDHQELEKVEINQIFSDLCTHIGTVHMPAD
jgi:hypothetical protein